MTPNPETVQPGATLQAAAQRMDALNVGALPVVEDNRVVGVLTDRDIVVRSTAVGQDPRTTKVAEVMTAEPRTVTVNATVLETIRMMEDQQLRRVPVLDPTGAVVGIVSLGDLAAAGTPEAADALEAISTPAEPDR
ncbi:MAG: CBS domain-containing protein [Proteobacteria bacterium]|nr:CBS domain-containing protein [Pseudomonadota bacterium]